MDELLPAGSPGQLVAHSIAHYLTRLGDVGSGALLGLIVVALLVMGGIWLMVLIAEGVERLSTIIKEMKSKDAPTIAAAREEGRTLGIEEGREEMRAIAQALLVAFDIDEGTARERLVRKGIDPDIILSSRDPRQSPEAEEWTAEAVRAMIDDAVRASLLEYLKELGVNTDGKPPSENADNPER